ATRFTMLTALSGATPGLSPAALEERRRELLDDLRRSQPRLILIIDPPFPELDRFIRESYVQAGMHFIDYHDRRPTEPVMQVLMDRNRPVAEIDWNWHRAFLLK